MRATLFCLLTSLLLMIVSGHPKSIITNSTTDIIPSADEKIRVTYTVLSSSHEISMLTLNVKPHTSLFDIMKMAQVLNKKFRFEANIYSFGAYITSIGGKEEDPEMNLYWMLYDCSARVDDVKYDDLLGCTLSDTGVSITYPENRDKWVFRYQYYNWEKVNSINTEEHLDIISP